jgi:hypothetical protein
MRRINMTIALAATISLALVLSAIASDVTQGKCLNIDAAKNLLTIDEYDLNFSKGNPYGKATGKNLVFDISDAKIGVIPAVGDILRIAFETKGSEKIALKIMNVSKQDLMKK